MHCCVKNNIFCITIFVPAKFICMYIISFKNVLKLLKYGFFMCWPPKGYAILIYTCITSNYIVYPRQLICFHFNKYCGCQDSFFQLRASKLIIQGKEKGSGKGKWHSFISHDAHCLFALVFWRRGINKMNQCSLKDNKSTYSS